VSAKAYHWETRPLAWLRRSRRTDKLKTCRHGGAGIGGSSRSCLHEKHSILLFFLGKRSLLVLRFASCEAAMRGAGIGGSSPSVGISPSRGLRCQHASRRKSPRRRLLPSRRRRIDQRS
jgi:hypothetical protein